MPHIPCNSTFSSLLIALMWSQTVLAKVCDSGWFGSQCQYRCHCQSKLCRWDGKCSTGACERGWFGPGCQYLDLAATGQVEQVQDWTSDGNESTCNPNQQADPVVINMAVEFVFKWLRLQVNDPSKLMDIYPIFSNVLDVKHMECAKIKKSVVNKNTIDIHCELREAARIVTLKGKGVKSLCSIYISGGRNLALRQKTIQSTTYSTKSRLEYLSSSMNAVDGNTDSNWTHGSCISTNYSDARPLWGVVFRHKQIITRYIVYNSDSNLDALKGFNLRSYTDDMVTVFDYTDTQPNGSAVYIINDKSVQTISVSMVTIHIDTEDYDPILKMCEVEIYGDSACPPAMYGRDCEHKCNCADKRDQCFVSTGGCPSGCVVGFQGEGCKKPCDFGKYGKDCSFLCSEYCTLKDTKTPCNHIDGKCVHGCDYWYALPKCQEKSKTINAIVFVIVFVILGCSVTPLMFIFKNLKSQPINNFYSEVAMLPNSPLVLSRNESEIFNSKRRNAHSKELPPPKRILTNAAEFTSYSSV